MSDDAGRIWHTGNTDDAGRWIEVDLPCLLCLCLPGSPRLPEAALVVTLPVSLKEGSHE